MTAVSQPAGTTAELGDAATAVRDVVVDGVPARVWGVGLACCALEVIEGLATIGVPADTSASAQVNVVVMGGTVSRGIKGRLDALWHSIPEPKVAVAFGVCTISGGPYWDSYAVLPGLRGEYGPAVEVPGCPPRADVLYDAITSAVRQARLRADVTSAESDGAR